MIGNECSIVGQQPARTSRSSWPFNLVGAQCEKGIPDFYNFPGRDKNVSTMANAGRILLLCAIVWLILVGIVAVTFWPFLPSTPLGWVAFVILAPPLYLLGEAVFEWLWSSRFGRAVANCPSAGMRICGGVLIGAILLAVPMWLSWRFGLQ